MARTPSDRPKGPRRQEVDAATGRTKYVRYSYRLGYAIAQRVGRGEAWSHICAQDGMPSYQTLYSWVKRYPEFADAMTIAREEAAERKAHRALEVAEGTEKGVPGDRLRVSTLMQLAALEAPERWGGKTPKAEAKAAEPVKITFYIRHFEKVVGPDGEVFVREVPMEGSREP